MRRISTSRRLAGRVSSSPASAARISASAAYGLPPDRWWMRAISDSPSTDCGSPPSRSVSWARVSTRVIGTSCDLDDVRRPAYVLEPFAEHLVDLVGAERDDDREPLPVQRRAQVGEHLQRRDVGAVQVVEDEHGRLQLGGPVEHRGDRRDQPRLVRRPPPCGPRARAAAGRGRSGRDRAPWVRRSAAAGRSASAARPPAARTGCGPRGSRRPRPGRPRCGPGAGRAPRRAAGSCPRRPHPRRARPRAARRLRT